MPGATAKGRSISESRKERPLKRDVVTSQAAATAKVVSKRTDKPAQSSVNSMAERAARSCSDAAKTSQQRRKASTNTAARGSNRKRARKTKATPMRVQRTAGDSVVGDWWS